MKTTQGLLWWIGLLGALLLGVPLAATAQVANAPLFSVSLKDAEASVASALIAEGVADAVKADIISTRQPYLYQYKQPLEVQVRTLKHDPADRSWSANLLFAHEGEVVSAMPVSGRYEETVRVPVLTQRMTHGEMIAASHIEIKEFPASKIRQNVVTDPEQLVGSTPRRTISLNRPIRIDEVQQPDVVEKGSLLKMTYQTPYMEISTSGEALENGAIGQAIRIRNQDSKTVVYGTVLSADEVQVTRQPARARMAARK